MYGWEHDRATDLVEAPAQPDSQQAEHDNQAKDESPREGRAEGLESGRRRTGGGVVVGGVPRASIGRSRPDLVADRDWFHEPADMFFEFYTDPR